MRFFRRDNTDDGSAIEEFWTWWATARDRIAAAIEGGTVGDSVAEISDRVDRVHKDLAWELAPGRTSKHALVVSPEGNPVIRPNALNWLAAAPPPDGTWEYYASRQPGELGVLQAGGVEVDLGEVRSIASWNSDRQRVDVKLWHPNLETAPEYTRSQVGFLFLDNLLGEDTVERWIGEIDVLDAAIGGRTADELRAEVQRQAAAASTESWMLATRMDKRGDEAIVLVNTSIKPIDHPFHQHHAVVTVAVGSEHLAGDEARGAELEQAEERLVEAMAGASAVHLGRVTERRRREIHFVAQSAEPARAAAESWSKAERHLQPEIKVRHDPEWSFRDQIGL
jgi:Family of unknown function (DUF695)